MREETVQIFSDETNCAIMRHPDRRFPGVLVQGDTLHGLCTRMDKALEDVGRESQGYDDLNIVRNVLWSLKTHYKETLIEHNLPMPFSEQ
ncbi:MAG: hypothetical protein AAFN59_10625 [Pseudomonadota bacterium]